MTSSKSKTLSWSSLHLARRFPFSENCAALLACIRINIQLHCKLCQPAVLSAHTDTKYDCDNTDTISYPLIRLLALSEYLLLLDINTADSDSAIKHWQNRLTTLGDPTLPSEEKNKTNQKCRISLMGCKFFNRTKSLSDLLPLCFCLTQNTRVDLLHLALAGPDM